MTIELNITGRLLIIIEYNDEMKPNLTPRRAFLCVTRHSRETISGQKTKDFVRLSQSNKNLNL